MSDLANNEGAPQPGRLTALWRVVVDGIAALGTLLIGILMLIICADIVARNVLGGSLPLVSELGAMMVVLIVALQLAATVRAERLARAMVFMGPLQARSPRAARMVDGLYGLIGAAVVGGMAWATVRVLEKDWEAGEFIGTPGLGTLPTWPFRALILLGLTVAALEFLRRALRAIIGART
ncbi:TRAP transporter small permease subunit [Mesobacterium pallidum]|uniref:TRAP transporter small permease subunit n=1 Tax=Mesobacterium pallidum TaxID=2872037 RepID=UPI001EE1BD88|nr:TRAP transporter small permease subunit [Mesobacterium pallidum]